MEKASISAEEFLRFQTQLLDLRQAQISANDAKFRAENRVKQLEEELARTQSALCEAKSISSRLHIDELKHENKLLRDKLLSTESSFQLQSTTLRAECHRLCNELDRRNEEILKANDEVCAIRKPVIQENFTQTDFINILECSHNYTLDDIIELENSVKLANISFDKLSKLVGLFESRISEMELKYSTEVSDYQKKWANITSEYNSLLVKLNDSETVVFKAQEIEKDLRNQIESIKRRSEKLNRELRRQLGRFLRSTGSEVDSGQDLTKNSIHSSSSSLASAINGTSSLGNESVNNERSNGLCKNDQASVTSGGYFDMPPGFFSMADFKAVIDRMSEVQDENCGLRRQNQRLNHDLMAKSRVIQSELNRYLTNQSVSSSNNIRTNQKLDNTNISTASWFPFLKLNTSNTNTNNGSHNSLPSINMETINRLRLMCEELISKNIELTEQLESYQIKT